MAPLSERRVIFKGLIYWRFRLHSNGVMETMIDWICIGPIIVVCANSYRTTNSSPCSFFMNITNGTGGKPTFVTMPLSPVVI